jgi:hypothetical protein
MFGRGHGSTNKNQSELTPSAVTCCECQEPGHKANKHPNRKISRGGHGGREDRCSRHGRSGMNAVEVARN